MHRQTSCMLLGLQRTMCFEKLHLHQFTAQLAVKSRSVRQCVAALRYTVIRFLALCPEARREEWIWFNEVWRACALYLPCMAMLHSGRVQGHKTGASRFCKTAALLAMRCSGLIIHHAPPCLPFRKPRLCQRCVFQQGQDCALLYMFNSL